MRGSVEVEIAEVRDGLLGASLGELSGRAQPTDDRDDLEIEQVGCGQRFAPDALAGVPAVDIVVDQCGRNDAGVNDDHGRREPVRL